MRTTLDHLELPWWRRIPKIHPGPSPCRTQCLDTCKNNSRASKIEISDFGDGCLAFHARRGTPTRLFNFHLDTVPASEHWTKNPFELVVESDRAYGLGACDIKGALACMLHTAQNTSGDLAILVNTDEEAGTSHTIRSFLKQDHDYTSVVVAEPTLNQAVTAHRGVVNAVLEFEGIPGHASELRALQDNAIHKAMQWGNRAIDYAGTDQTQFDNLQGIRLNVGTITGGIKPNMIAPSASLKLGLRTLPGQSGLELLDALSTGPAQQQPKHMEITLELPAMPGPTNTQAWQANQALAKELVLPIGPTVDFWTEGALFSGAGLPTVVIGSGDIAQAHTADEWVALEQLHLLEQTYGRLIQ